MLCRIWLSHFTLPDVTATMVIDSRNNTAPTNTVCTNIAADLADALMHSIKRLSEMGCNAAHPTL